VQGVVFDASLLGAVTGERKIKLLKKLAVLERKARLIASSGKCAFRFAGGGLHHAVYAAIDDARRCELHGAYADALREDLQESEEPLDAATAHAIVRHLLAAGRLEEAEAEIGFAIEHAAAHQHPAHGAAFLERIVAALGDGDAELRFEARMRLASLLALLGRSRAWLEALEAARADAAAIGGDAERARVHAGVAAAFHRAGRYAEAAEEAERGLAAARAAGAAGAEAECVHMLGGVAFRQGDFPAAAERYEEALRLRRAAGDRRGEAHALQAIGSVMQEVGRGTAALPTKQKALEIFREIGDRRGEGAAINNVGNSYVDGQRLEEALPCYELASEIAAECGDLPAEAAALLNRGRAFAVLARIEEAKDCLERALDIFREIGDPAGEAESLDELGWAIAGFGEREQAIVALERARAAAERTGQHALLVRILRHLANVRHEAGHRDDAWRLFERARDLSRNGSKARLLVDMGNAALKEGDHGRAVELLTEAATAGHGGSRGILCACRLARALKAAGRAEEARAAAHDAESRILEEQRVAPQHGPEIYYSLGTVLEDDERGREYLEKANDLLGARTRSIRSIVHRQHYLTMTWPNREILEEARRL
jgi:tetratricopeptide (TPR) repeat protein